MVLTGWAFVLPGLTTFGTDTPMRPNTAVGLILLGVAVWQLGLQPGRAAWRRAGLVAAGAAAAIGVLTLAQYALPVDLGIDGLLMPGRAYAATLDPGRMGLNTAGSLALLGIALLALGRGARRRFSEISAVLVAAIAVTTFIGHLYGVAPLTRITALSTQMALHTSVLLFLLSATVLQAVPDGRLSRVLTSQGMGSLACRRLLAWIVPALIGLGWLRLKGQQAGLYGTEFGLSFMVLASVFVIVVVFLRGAAAIDRLEAEQLRERDARLVAEVRFNAVQEANRLKSRYLADMSHELRTPMNGIIGFAEFLYDGRVPPASPKFREYLGDILGCAQYLMRLINDLLDLAKVEAGKLQFRPEPLSLVQVAEEVRNTLQPLFTKKRVAVEAIIEPAIVEVVLDEVRLKQVVYNLLSNAIKFTPPEGRVVLRARPEGEELFRLEVEDTGIGIPEADLPRLFQEFQQVHARESTPEAGTGLGLALTKRLVEAQGGQVGVSSSLGQGSIFFALLPRNASRA